MYIREIEENELLVNFDINEIAMIRRGLDLLNAELSDPDQETELLKCTAIEGELRLAGCILEAAETNPSVFIKNMAAADVRAGL